MDTYNASALKLQKNLLNLRTERDRLISQNRHSEAQALEAPIALLEDAIKQLPPALKPGTLQ
ncbi:MULTISPECIES: hypothetical protein [Pseudomonas]|uniref:hypothetical protein n=1 Tax=Pseudomonas TaxID=286 RepID=UPI00041AE290|nr:MULTISPECIES: hypothetical protein [Pseudomonas]MBK4988463.1 hypothetical protein [Pseudomonas sp. S36]MBK5009005.1 hypothetical protein [Pseudomonas sp. S60]